MSLAADPRGPLASRAETRSRRLAGLRAGVPQVGPATVHVDLANRCNTTCVTCWHHSPLLRPEHRPSPATLRQLLPWATYCRLLDDLQELGGLEELILSGMGEPLLHPDAYQMLARAQQQGLAVTLITNLLAADLARLVPLAAGGRLKLLVSVCGADEASWNLFHRTRGASGFATVRTGLGELRRVGGTVHQVQVILRENCELLPEMVAFGAQTGAAGVSFKLASLAHGTEGLALDPEQRARLLEHGIPEACALADRLGVATDLPAFATQLGPDPLRCAPMEQVGCFMGYLYARVTVDGDLLYCCDPEIVVGRLGPGSSFGALWRSPRYQELRERLGRGEFFPGCARCGKYKQNLKWSHKLAARASAGPVAGGEEG
ncbi:MAG: radical SAM protein [Myxococcota bacterium]|jgi:MoaA/NifB/PqqE/SkfB family radical SAM enzyme|nr:radical SAM protein [Myxococcota bacterium]